jgi:thiamine-monophosphate kinase
MAETVGGLGEFGLIAAVVARLPQGEDVLLGPGDDAAVVRVPDGRVVATTDLLVEGRHFRRDWSSGYDMGRKAAAQNLADIAAMGARSVALLVGLAAPGSLPVDDALDLAHGLRDEAALVSASVVGGDVVASDALVVAVTALGVLDGRPPVTRGGARPGDVVAVCGRLGWSAAGLALLVAEADQPAEAVAAHRRPEPPYAAGPAAAAAGAHALCDVSDGLLQDLGHVARASGVGMELDLDAFIPDQPVAVAAQRLGVDPLRWMLTGGEDHALAACFPPAQQLPGGWRVVGRVVEGGVVRAGGYERLAGGWEHFR